MNSPPQPTPPFSGVDEPSSTAFEWANLLDFTLEDQFDIRWSPDNQTPSTLGLESVSVSEEASNRGSDASDKTRKRDPRLTCQNFLAGRIPCSCPEVDQKEEEEVQAARKRIRKPAVCQVPGCEVDISELKGYHKRHRVCLRCATATSVLLDAQYMRYCQQCGKFHILPDFDEDKRSCRRKLERHNNRRRRKPTEFKVAVENGTKVDQEDIACEDKAEKDENLNESEDGNVSPLSSQPDSQSIQSGNVKSFVTFGETGMEGAPDKSKYSASTDNKNAYSSVCPTGRISFKLYDWNPAEFPRRLRHQIFQWLASMPVELEGYIRPGCTILTVFIAMPHFMWDKLSEDAARHIHNFVNAPKSILFGRDSMTIYFNDRIFHSLKGRTSLMNIKTEVLAPRLHYVQPSCFESGKPMEFVACGSNLPRSRFRFLVSFAGRYLAYDDFHAISCGCTGLFFGNEEDNARNSEHQMYKIYISSTDPALSGPAFVEVQNESGTSNFIPILFGDKHICSEIQIVQQRLVDAPFSKENKNGKLGATSESCNDSVFRQAAISELLLDIGWLLKEPKSDDMQSHLTLIQIQRFNYLLKFLIQNESTIVLEKILDSLSIVMDTKQFDNQDNVTGDAAMRLFQKNVQHARTIVHQRLHEQGEQILRSASSMESMDYLSIYDGENDMLSSRSTNEDIEKANKTNWRPVNTVSQQNSEAAPLLNKEVVMNLTNRSHPGKVWPPKTCTRFLSTSIMSSRSLFLTVAVVMCFGICAVVVHPKKVGEFAVVIHRCLFGSSKT